MKQYVKRLVFFTACLLLTLMGYNYIVDDYGFFRGDYSTPKLGAPEHYVKMKFLLQNPKKYNAFCFGPSRVGSIDLTRIHNGNTYYNMTYAAGLPYEWLNDMKQLIAGGVEIRQILLGVDNVSYWGDPKVNEKNFLRRPYKEYDWEQYVWFLLQKPSTVSTKTRGTMFDIYGTGRPFHYITEKEIEKDPQKYADNLPYISTRGSGNRMDEAMHEIQEIKDLADENGIDLIVFINPMSRVNYLEIDLDEFNEFKRRLAEITGYYDFSGLNKIAVDNHNYYDTAHYRPNVGDKIVDRIFGMEESFPRGFGVWVTKDNIEEHICDLENELNSY